MTEALAVRADEAITILSGTLRAAQSRLEMEEHEYNKKRDRMVRVAHQRGTDNSIGSALDDLLEEFGLPRRPYRGMLEFVLRLDYPVTGIPDSGRLQTTGTNRLYWQEGMRVTFPLTGSVYAFLYEGTCLCDNAFEPIRQWAQEYTGEAVGAEALFQYTHLTCQHPDCPNRPVRRSASRLPAAQRQQIDWSGVPSHPVRVVTPATT